MTVLAPVATSDGYQVPESHYPPTYRIALHIFRDLFDLRMFQMFHADNLNRVFSQSVCHCSFTLEKR